MRTEFQTITDALSGHIIGKPQQLKLAVTCLLAKGHLLIEDLPGMGKTTLSHALANVFGLSYSRIQFTSDLLPADMLGVNVFDQQQHELAAIEHGQRQGVEHRQVDGNQCGEQEQAGAALLSQLGAHFDDLHRA